VQAFDNAGTMLRHRRCARILYVRPWPVGQRHGHAR